MVKRIFAGADFPGSGSLLASKDTEKIKGVSEKTLWGKATP